jgi:hypothetical protein
MSDHMPASFREIAESAQLARKFLYPTFPEHPHPGLVGVANAFGRNRLAHPHELNVCRFAPAPLRRSR